MLEWPRFLVIDILDGNLYSPNSPSAIMARCGGLLLARGSGLLLARVMPYHIKYFKYSGSPFQRAIIRTRQSPQPHTSGYRPNLRFNIGIALE